MSNDLEFGPEPWRVTRVFGSYECDDKTGGGDNDFPGAEISRDGHKAFIQVWGNSEEEAHSIARLVVAAPRMLRLLERATYEMEASGGWPGDEDLFSSMMSLVSMVREVTTDTP